MKDFNILKKNRKYFAATTAGYKCKILIDDNSADLEVGEQTLEVDDISVRSKYGTDLIFKLKAPVAEQEAAGICSLRHPHYNRLLVERAKKLGGKWDKDESAWIFSSIVEQEVEELDDLFNSDVRAYDVTFTEGCYGDKEPVYLFGIEFARAWGRDSGATIGSEVALISGRVTSGGSRANWLTVIREGAVFRVNLPAGLVEERKDLYDFCDVVEHKPARGDGA